MQLNINFHDASSRVDLLERKLTRVVVHACCKCKRLASACTFTSQICRTQLKYLPQLWQRDNVSRTDDEVITWLLVSGQMPPLARVAAIVLTDSQFTSKEHNCQV